MKKFDKLKRMILIAGIDSIATQVYLDLFLGGFRVSTSVIFLPIFLYHYQNINPIIQAFFITTIGLFARIMFGLADYGSVIEAFSMEYPTMVFDFMYGFIFFYLFYRSNNKTLTRWFSVILFNDFFSNICELVFRYKSFNSDVIQAIPTLLTVACIRSVIAITIILILKYYRLLLKNEEHDERYKNLLVLTSDLNSETYLMNKNIAHIEFVMNNAYHLYEVMSDSDNEELRDLSLTIAKDVHEIKKNYIQVIKGLETIAVEKPNYSYMKLKDLFAIIEDNFRKSLGNDSNVRINFKCRSNFYIKQHYLIMSVLRNLIYNSVEALGDMDYGVVEVEEHIYGDDCRFVIKDNGKGIKEKDLDFIFDAGYSTKFNETTGDISRGLGLTLVKEIVEVEFEGKITVLSEQNHGTRFFISIPLKNLEVSENEVLYSR